MAKIKNITAVANVDLKITKDVNVSGVISVTDRVKFTITVTNNGPCNATGVYVGERLSPHLRHVSNVTTIGEYDGATWIIGNLNSGEVHNLTIIAEVISEGNISNVVAIFGNDNDTNKSNNNFTSENVTALPVVDIMVNKTVNVTLVNVTDFVKYTITGTTVGDWFTGDLACGEASIPSSLDVLYPSQVTSIGYNYPSNTAKLVCLATTPPQVEGLGSNIPDALIYVPDAAVNTYKEGVSWSEMIGNIYPISEYQGNLPV